MASRMALRAPCMRQRTCGGGSGAGPCAGCHAPTAPYLTSGGNANAGARVHVQRPRLLQSGELARRRSSNTETAASWSASLPIATSRVAPSPRETTCSSSLRKSSDRALARDAQDKWRRGDTQPSFEEQDDNPAQALGITAVPKHRHCGPLQRAAIAGTAIVSEAARALVLRFSPRRRLRPIDDDRCGTLARSFRVLQALGRHKRRRSAALEHGWHRGQSRGRASAGDRRLRCDDLDADGDRLVNWMPHITALKKSDYVQELDASQILRGSKTCRD